MAKTVKTSSQHVKLSFGKIEEIPTDWKIKKIEEISKKV